jgi:peroxiredoxin
VTIPLLVDAGSEVIKAYGILNEDQGEVPHPTVILLDKEGVIRFFHLDENYKRRPPAETLIEAAREIADAAK